jgi:hypothetical protein
MKFRHEKIQISEAEERLLEESIRSTSSQQPGEVPPPDVYWQNLIVRTNERIDRSTSGKAISINWALRVAIPGVLAILSFAICLHYYVPETTHHDESVSALVLSLPSQSVDSLLVAPPPEAGSMSQFVSGDDVFSFSADQIAEYLISRGSAQTLVGSLSDQQLGDVEVALGSRED